MESNNALKGVVDLDVTMVEWLTTVERDEAAKIQNVPVKLTFSDGTRIKCFISEILPGTRVRKHIVREKMKDRSVFNEVG